MSIEDDFISRCAHFGLATPSKERLYVARQACANPVPFRPEKIVQLAQNDGTQVSRSTVYRTLNMLVLVGMVVKDGDYFRREVTKP